MNRRWPSCKRPPGSAGWHGGPTAVGILRSVSLAEALLRAHDGGHSIWEIALHLAYWKYCVRRHLVDEQIDYPAQRTTWVAAPDDPTDRASQETDMALELRGRDRDRKLIKKIEASIVHLSSGDFGYCENCGEEIGLKRLEARPTANLCIDCKTLDDIREKQLS